jgi:hypothetical protein
VDTTQFFDPMTSTAANNGTKLTMENVVFMQIISPPLRRNFDIDGDNLVLGMVLVAGIVSLLTRQK